MALELKIKDILKWKLEAFEQKAKHKDDKVLQVEMAVSRLEQHLNETMNMQNHVSSLEGDSIKHAVSQIQDRMDQHDQTMNMVTEQLTKHLTTTVTEQVTDRLIQSIMPQLDTRIKKYIDEDNASQNKSSQIDSKIAEIRAKLEKQIEEMTKQTEKDL